MKKECKNIFKALYYRRAGDGNDKEAAWYILQAIYILGIGA
jgi:hypothetical protein